MVSPGRSASTQSAAPQAAGPSPLYNLSVRSRSNPAPVKIIVPATRDQNGHVERSSSRGRSPSVESNSGHHHHQHHKSPHPETDLHNDKIVGSGRKLPKNNELNTSVGAVGGGVEQYRRRHHHSEHHKVLHPRSAAAAMGVPPGMQRGRGRATRNGVERSGPISPEHLLTTHQQHEFVASRLEFASSPPEGSQRPTTKPVYLDAGVNTTAHNVSNPPEHPQRSGALVAPAMSPMERMKSLLMEGGTTTHHDPTTIHDAAAGGPPLVQDPSLDVGLDDGDEASFSQMMEKTGKENLVHRQHQQYHATDTATATPHNNLGSSTGTQLSLTEGAVPHYNRRPNALDSYLERPSSAATTRGTLGRGGVHGHAMATTSATSTTVDTRYFTQRTNDAATEGAGPAQNRNQFDEVRLHRRDVVGQHGTDTETMGSGEMDVLIAERLLHTQTAGTTTATTDGRSTKTETPTTGRTSVGHENKHEKRTYHARGSTLFNENTSTPAERVQQPQVVAKESKGEVAETQRAPHPLQNLRVDATTLQKSERNRRRTLAERAFLLLEELRAHHKMRLGALIAASAAAQHLKAAQLKEELGDMVAASAQHEQALERIEEEESFSRSELKAHEGREVVDLVMQSRCIVSGFQATTLRANEQTSRAAIMAECVEHRQVVQQAVALRERKASLHRQAHQMFLKAALDVNRDEIEARASIHDLEEQQFENKMEAHRHRLESLREQAIERRQRGFRSLLEELLSEEEAARIDTTRLEQRHRRGLMQWEEEAFDAHVRHVQRVRGIMDAELQERQMLLQNETLKWHTLLSSTDALLTAIYSNTSSSSINDRSSLLRSPPRSRRALRNRTTGLEGSTLNLALDAADRERELAKIQRSISPKRVEKPRSPVASPLAMPPSPKRTSSQPILFPEPELDESTELEVAVEEPLAPEEIKPYTDAETFKGTTPVTAAYQRSTASSRSKEQQKKGPHTPSSPQRLSFSTSPGRNDSSILEEEGMVGSSERRKLQTSGSRRGSTVHEKSPAIVGVDAQTSPIPSLRRSPAQQQHQAVQNTATSTTPSPNVEDHRRHSTQPTQTTGSTIGTNTSPISVPPPTRLTTSSIGTSPIVVKEAAAVSNVSTRLQLHSPGSPSSSSPTSQQPPPPAAAVEVGTSPLLFSPSQHHRLAKEEEEIAAGTSPIPTIPADDEDDTDVHEKHNPLRFSGHSPMGDGSGHHIQQGSSSSHPHQLSAEDEGFLQNMAELSAPSRHRRSGSERVANSNRVVRESTVDSDSDSDPDPVPRQHVVEYKSPSASAGRESRAASYLQDTASSAMKVAAVSPSPQRTTDGGNSVQQGGMSSARRRPRWSVGGTPHSATKYIPALDNSDDDEAEIPHPAVHPNTPSHRTAEGPKRRASPAVVSRATIDRLSQPKTRNVLSQRESPSSAGRRTPSTGRNATPVAARGRTTPSSATRTPVSTRRLTNMPSPVEDPHVDPKPFSATLRSSTRTPTARRTSPSLPRQGAARSASPGGPPLMLPLARTGSMQSTGGVSSQRSDSASSVARGSASPAGSRGGSLNRLRDSDEPAVSRRVVRGSSPSVGGFARPTRSSVSRQQTPTRNTSPSPTPAMSATEFRAQHRSMKEGTNHVSAATRGPFMNTRSNADTSPRKGSLTRTFEKMEEESSFHTIQKERRHQRGQGIHNDEDDALHLSANTSFGTVGTRESRQVLGSYVDIFVKQSPQHTYELEEVAHSLSQQRRSRREASVDSREEGRGAGHGRRKRLQSPSSLNGSVASSAPTSMSGTGGRSISYAAAHQLRAERRRSTEHAASSGPTPNTQQRQVNMHKKSARGRHQHDISDMVLDDDNVEKDTSIAATDAEDLSKFVHYTGDRTAIMHTDKYFPKQGDDSMFLVDDDTDDDDDHRHQQRRSSASATTRQQEDQHHSSYEVSSLSSQSPQRDQDDWERRRGANARRGGGGVGPINRNRRRDEKQSIEATQPATMNSGRGTGQRYPLRVRGRSDGGRGGRGAEGGRGRGRRDTTPPTSTTSTQSQPNPTKWEQQQAQLYLEQSRRRRGL